MKKNLILSIFLLTFFYTKGIAHAQEFSVGVYPPILRIEASLPSMSTSDIIISNNSEKQINFDIVLKPFEAESSYDGSLKYIDDFISGKDPLIRQKIKVFHDAQEVKSITLEPYEAKIVNLQIESKKGDPQGDYYFSVIFLTKGKDIDQRSYSAIPGGIATNVLLSVGEKGPTSGTIGDFKTKFFLTKGPVPFSLLINNTSNHIVTPEGTITIKNMFGQKIGKISLLPDYILNNSSRYLRDTSQASPSAETISKIEKIYEKQILTLKKPNPLVLWDESFIFGLYRAELNLNLGDDVTISDKTYFFALPILFMIVIILAIIIASGIYLRVKKRI